MYLWASPVRIRKDQGVTYTKAASMLWTCIHYRSQKNPAQWHTLWERRAAQVTSIERWVNAHHSWPRQGSPGGKTCSTLLSLSSSFSSLDVAESTPSLSQSSLWVFLLHAFLTRRSSVSPLSHSRCPFSTVQLLPLFAPGSPCAFDSINLSFESSIRANPWPRPLLQCLTSFAQVICQIDERVANDWMRRPSNRKAQSLFLTNQKPWLHSGLATP